MSIPLKLLLVEDSEVDARLLMHALRQGGYDATIIRVENRADMIDALADRSVQIVISDYRLPEFTAPEALETLKETGQDLPFIIVSGTVGEEKAVDAMKAGAHDYVMKDNLLRLIPAIQRELHEAESRRHRSDAEDALRESERRFRTLADSAPVLIWITDADGNYTYVNKTWLDFINKSGYAGESAAASVHPDDAPNYTAVREAAFAERRPFQTEYRLRRHDGEWRWVLETGTPRVRADSEFVGFIGTCIDMSDRKRAELERETILRENEALLEEKAAIALQQRSLLKDILFSVTEGKLVLCHGADELPAPFGPPIETIALSEMALYSTRHAAEAVAMARGLSGDRITDFVTAVGEAGMNAVVHGGGGEAAIHGAEGCVQVWISDHGRGIDIAHLPRATLERGYTTASSLGHGFFIMLGCADKLYLLTGVGGTTIVLEQYAEAPTPAWLERAFAAA
jgi:PAS domain S-box-containing protein